MRNTKRILVAVGMALAVTISAVPVQIASGTQIVAQAATIKLNKKSVVLDVGKTQKTRLSGVQQIPAWQKSAKVALLPQYHPEARQ